jgi:peptidoglycan/xylan/chitin deacetylase (PgdA/CDA1 family)
MYHEIERPGRSLCSTEPGYVRYVVRETDFKTQLESLRRRGTIGVSVGDANKATGMQQSHVVVTFDDGCESDLAIAAPLLAAQRFRATFYITTGFLGRRGFLVRHQVRELADLGFEIGCHAATHRYLIDLETSELDGEIAGAKRTLEDIIGRPVEHFSCPGGRWDDRVMRAVRSAGFLSMATSDIGVNAPAAYRLDRLAVMRSTSLNEFEDLCAGRGLLVPKLKTGALRVAKRLLGNARYEQLRARLLRERA